MKKLKIAFYGSSLVSAYWNGAATYYRGIIKALHALGHKVTFYEPDAFDRQLHRDMPNPRYAKVVVYPAKKEAVYEVIKQGVKEADVLIKASGVGVFDDLLEDLIVNEAAYHQVVLYWDVDAPATLASLQQNPGCSLKQLLPYYDLVLTYGGGDPIIKKYLAMGAVNCIPVYNALDPETHHPVRPDKRFGCDLAFLGNRLPDREARADEFFFKTAALLPGKKFLLGGNGWQDKAMPPNVSYAGHVYTKDHNAFNCTPGAVLNISRESMACNGFSPATRVFEAAGAGACVITDAWEGIEMFLEPGREILTAQTGEEAAEILESLDRRTARKIGRAAKERICKDHTYALRAKQVEQILTGQVKSNTYANI